MANAKDSSPLEAFRLLTASTMRAVSRKDVNVTFVPDGGQMMGNEARLTVPARDLPPDDVARARGESDSLALKMRHHDRRMHLKRMPTGEAARAVYDIVEQVRVEALGARRMPGMAENLNAVWNERCEQKGYRRVKSRDDAQFSDVVGLMVREKLLGEAPPEAITLDRFLIEKPSKTIIIKIKGWLVI